MSSNNSSAFLLCPDPWKDNETKFTLKALDFWCDGVLMSLICMFGILGNLVTIGIFSRAEMRSTFHANLSVLATYDLLFILLSLFDSMLHMVDLGGPFKASYPDPDSRPNKLWLGLYPYFLWPFSNIFMTASMFMTMAVSIDRFIVVCYPFCACRRESTMNNPKWPNKCPVDRKRIIAYGLISLTCAIFYCFPTFFEYEISARKDGSKSVFWTDMRSSMEYSRAYTIYIDLIVRFIIPFCVLTFTNVRIFVEIRRQKALNEKVKNHMSFTFFIVVLIFLFCQTGRCVANISDGIIHVRLASCQFREKDPSYGSPAWNPHFCFLAF